MKYHELQRLLKKYGCYPTGKQTSGHPEWYSPITGGYFPMSNHGSEEVRKGTLNTILKQSGVK
jgi:predicted RNA binding protein YcfA (HicA-like mRNA interferase family)